MRSQKLPKICPDCGELLSGPVTQVCDAKDGSLKCWCHFIKSDGTIICPKPRTVGKEIEAR
jgi:hypothetical protein